MTPHRSRALGGVLIAAGVIGVVTGGIPLTVNAWRVLTHDHLRPGADLAAHGARALGLSVEWAMLSSAMGIFLGVLLLAAGLAWLRGRPSAPLLTWVYVFGGLMVNIPDMLIFIFKALPGRMRTTMLLLDGLATLFPLLVALWLRRLQPRPSNED